MKCFFFYRNCFIYLNLNTGMTINDKEKQKTDNDDT